MGRCADMKNEQEIREYLINNTIRLIAEGGFEKATTKAITYDGEPPLGLKMNEVYIYRLFGNKEKLYTKAFECLDEEFVFSQTNATPVFPLEFSFGFQGSMFNNERVVKNAFFAPAPVLLKISGSITTDLHIYIKDKAGVVLSEISISEDLPAGSVIFIDPTTKKITITDASGATSNGYAITDKSKQSFLYLPQGEYTLGANIISGAVGKIEISIKRYLFD